MAQPGEPFYVKPSKAGDELTDEEVAQFAHALVGRIREFAPRKDAGTPPEPAQHRGQCSPARGDRDSTIIDAGGTDDQPVG